MRELGHHVATEVDDDGVRCVTVEERGGPVEPIPLACMDAMVDGPTDEWADEDTTPGFPGPVNRKRKD